MIVWRLLGKWVGVLSACAMQPEFVNHPVSGFKPFLRVLRPKQATVGDGPECVWKPVHEVHHCWLIPTVCGMRMCVKKTPSSTTHRGMPGAEPPVLATCLLHKIDC